VSDNGESVFAPLIEQPRQKQITEGPSPAQKLLDWLQRWDKPTITWQNIQNYGPRPKDRKKTIEAAEILVRNGWLIPLKPHRYDMHKWQVVRKPIACPEIDR
jgi:hypothetical protein